MLLLTIFVLVNLWEVRFGECKETKKKWFPWNRSLQTGNSNFTAALSPRKSTGMLSYQSDNSHPTFTTKDCGWAEE